MIGKKMNQKELCKILSDYFGGVFTGTLAVLVNNGIAAPEAYKMAAGVAHTARENELLRYGNIRPEINVAFEATFDEEDGENYFKIKYYSHSGNGYIFSFGEYFDCWITYPANCNLAEALDKVLAAKKWYEN